MPNNVKERNDSGFIYCMIANTLDAWLHFCNSESIGDITKAAIAELFDIVIKKCKDLYNNKNLFNDKINLYYADITATTHRWIIMYSNILDDDIITAINNLYELSKNECNKNKYVNKWLTTEEFIKKYNLTDEELEALATILSARFDPIIGKNNPFFYTEEKEYRDFILNDIKDKIKSALISESMKTISIYSSLFDKLKETWNNEKNFVEIEFKNNRENTSKSIHFNKDDRKDFDIVEGILVHNMDYRLINNESLPSDIMDFVITFYDAITTTQNVNISFNKSTNKILIEYN